MPLIDLFTLVFVLFLCAGYIDKNGNNILLAMYYRLHIKVCSGGPHVVSQCLGPLLEAGSAQPPNSSEVIQLRGLGPGEIPIPELGHSFLNRDKRFGFFFPTSRSLKPDIFRLIYLFVLAPSLNHNNYVLNVY